MDKDKKLNKRKKTVKELAKAESKWYHDRNTLIILSVIIVTVFITFFPALKNDFVNWDDGVNVYENKNIDHLTIENLKNIFTIQVIGNYNPLPILTFAIEKHFFGLDPFIYHLDNVLLHILNTILVFFLAVRLGLKRPAALILALLFGIQPMRVESVAWVTERKDVLYGFFTLSAMLCYALWLVKKKTGYLVWTYILFLISVFAKIQAVALPLSLLAIDYFMGRPLKWRLVTEKIPMFLVSLVIGLLGIYLLSKQQVLNVIDYAFTEKILIGTYSLMIYLVKSVIPYEMTAIYPFPPQGNLSFVFYLSPFILALIAVGIFLTRKRTKIFVFGSLFFLFNIMFLLQVVSAGQGFIADRFGYIAYFGLFFIYAHGFQWLLENRPKWRTAVWTMTAGILLLLGVVSHERVYAWRNPDTLWTDVISKYNFIAAAYNNRGKYYRDQKEYDKALADYKEVERLSPDDFNCFNSRGKLYFDIGQLDLALKDFNRAIKLDSTVAIAYSNRGAIFLIRNNLVEAQHDFTKAISLDSTEIAAYINRAIVRLYLGKYEDALADCDHFLQYDQEEPDIWDIKAECCLNMKDYGPALEFSNKAIRLNPGKGSYYLNRSRIYYFSGDKNMARSDAETAEKLGIKVDESYLSSLK